MLILPVRRHVSANVASGFLVIGNLLTLVVILD